MARILAPHTFFSCQLTFAGTIPKNVNILAPPFSSVHSLFFWKPLTFFFANLFSREKDWYTPWHILLPITDIRRERCKNTAHKLHSTATLTPGIQADFFVCMIFCESIYTYIFQRIVHTSSMRERKKEREKEKNIQLLRGCPGSRILIYSFFGRNGMSSESIYTWYKYIYM